MGWIKLDHILLTHPKVWAAPEAFGLYCAGLLYADIQQTDGFIPFCAIPNLLRVPKVERLQERLVSVGLWEVGDGGVWIYAYLKHNRSAAEIETLKAKRADAGAFGGRKKQANALASARPLLEQNASKPLASARPLLEQCSTRLQTSDFREEKKRLKDLNPLPQSATEGTLEFEDFWSKYPRQNNGTRPDRKKANDQWLRLKPAKRQEAVASLPHYQRHLDQNQWPPKYAYRFLRDQTFADFAVAPENVKPSTNGWKPYQNPPEEEYRDDRI